MTNRPKKRQREKGRRTQRTGLTRGWRGGPLLPSAGGKPKKVAMAPFCAKKKRSKRNRRMGKGNRLTLLGGARDLRKKRKKFLFDGKRGRSNTGKKEKRKAVFVLFKDVVRHLARDGENNKSRLRWGEIKKKKGGEAQNLGEKRRTRRTSASLTN